MNNRAGTMNTNKECLQRIYDHLATVTLEPLSHHDIHHLKAIIDHEASDEDAVMLTAFRHAANSIGIEAGIVAQHVGHDEPAIGDVYFLELIREAELRMKQLSTRYERLRAAIITALDTRDETTQGELEQAEAFQAVKEALGSQRTT